MLLAHLVGSKNWSEIFKAFSIGNAVNQPVQFGAPGRPPEPHPVGEEHAVRSGGVGVVVRARRRHEGHVVLQAGVQNFQYF